MRRSTLAFVAAAVAVVSLAGCSSSGGGATTTPSGSGSPSSSLSGDITVFAAASLTESFTTIGQQFEAAHPGTKVTFSFAASSALAEQINSGAPADVFASASGSTMTLVVDKGGAVTPVTFATNTMEIAVPPDNPGAVTGLDSLTSSSVKTALCQPEVPCGAVAAQVFTNAAITVKPVTLEPDVKSVLTKVELGEVDAGVVYVTDVKAAGDKVKGIEIPADVNASTSYPISALAKSSNASVAAAFVAYVVSDAGQAVLAAAGFSAP